MSDRVARRHSTPIACLLSRRRFLPDVASVVALCAATGSLLLIEPRPVFFRLCATVTMRPARLETALR